MQMMSEQQQQQHQTMTRRQTVNESDLIDCVFFFLYVDDELEHGFYVPELLLV